jgi:hypothetical protein
VKPLTIESTNPNLPSTFDSRYGNVYSAAQLTPSIDLSDNQIEERFIEEPIISMDETLIEAVERIIAHSGTGSKNSSVCSSRSTSRKGTKGAGQRERSMERNPAAAGAGVKMEVPRNECKKTVLSALEQIVRSVQSEREKEVADGDGEKEREKREKESFLREGVRAWLGSVEVGE